MPEQKEFHELFAQTNGRIFVLLISTDGRGHYDSRGQLVLDHCEAGQTFDLPKGMFDSDKYRETDVVFTFAKLEYDDTHTDEYVLVDGHPAKQPVNKTDSLMRPSAYGQRPQHSENIIFDGLVASLPQFLSSYQNRLTIHLSGHALNSYPQLLDYSDLYYAKTHVKANDSNTYDEPRIREQLFCNKLISLYPKSSTAYINGIRELRSTYLIPINKDENRSLSSYPIPEFNSIFEIVDADVLRQIRHDWYRTRILYSSPTQRVSEPTAGYAAKALELYADFLRDSPVGSIDRNLIYFGAPGTGKSHRLDEDLRQFDGRYERVTFYADYLHAQFVGSFRPKAATNEKGAADFTYAFTPGPFTRVLVDALDDGDDKAHVLVVEEINRADPASVFGDIFQLLDRNSNGASTYPITVSEDMKSYLWRNLTITGKRRLAAITDRSFDPDDAQEPASLSIALPRNMFLWATMNSADQGVYPMDTAFKRRWSFRYIGIDNGESAINAEWNEHRKTINRLLLAEVKVSEDKLIGPFFLGDPALAPGSREFDEAFKNKVIMYLFEDAARYQRDRIFDTDAVQRANGASYMGRLTLNALFTAWDESGFDIFADPNK